MQEQWSLTDLRTPGLMEGPVLPAGLDQAAKQTLPGRYHLQVLSAHDAGSPAYGQLQKLHQVETAALQHSSTLSSVQVEQENVRVSAEDASQVLYASTMMCCTSICGVGYSGRGRIQRDPGGGATGGLAATPTATSPAYPH